MIGAIHGVLGRRSERQLAALVVLALGALAAIAGQAGKLSSLTAALALFLWVLLGMVVDAKRVTSGRLPLGIPAIVLVLPFFHVFMPWGGWAYVFQAGVVALVVFYLSLVSPRERSDVFRRAWPILGPVLLLVAAVMLSYALSDPLTRKDLYALLDLATAAAFVLVAAFYCRSPRDIRRLVYIFVIGGMLQLPVVLGQAAGLMNNLPGGLAQLSPAAVGGSLAGRLGAAGGNTAIVVRYAGSFLGYENFAEYCGILVLLCVGMLLFERNGRRSALLAGAALGAVILGWFTGTRAFVLGTAGGLAVLFLAALLLSGSLLPRLWRLAAIVLLSVVAILVLVPGQVTAGFLSRLTNSDVSLSGPNAFNRLSMFRVWVRLAEKMPASGYGTRMAAVVSAGDPLHALWPHSLYFWGLLTAGYLGLLAVVVLVAVAVFMPIRSIFARAPARHRELACVFTAVTVYWAVNEAKIEFVRLDFYVDLVFLLLGMVSSLYVLSRDAAAASPRDASPAEQAQCNGHAGQSTEDEGARVR